MSAIWGCINYRNLPSQQSIKELMEKPYQRFKIDTYSVSQNTYSIMGICKQNLFSSDSSLAPIKQEEHLFVSDSFIDNYNELTNELEELGALSCPTPLSDNDILYLAYKTWGISFHEHVCGAFSCAITDTTAKSSYLFADHLSNRSIFYRLVNDTLYFSTIMDSLISIAPTVINDSWMTGFLSTYSPDMNIEEHATPYTDIFQLGPGEYLSFTENGLKLHKYWDPRRIKYQQIHATEEEYQKLLVDTVTLCIHSLLRPQTTIGCTLSSGLDSSTVACIAAQKLATTGQTLRSYTSVPLQEYQGNANTFFITNERPGVEKICAAYPNILPTYVDCNGKNSIDELYRIISSLGIPSKSMQNLVWLDEIYERASQNNCKLMLKGQYGNSTISYGNVMSVAYQQLSKFHIRRAYLTLKNFCQENRVSRKLAIKTFFSYYFERFISANPSQDSVASKELLKKYNLFTQLKKNAEHSGGTNMDSWQERKNFLFFPQGLAQLSMYDTLFGLQYGLLIRDPLKDKRLIELCCCLPITCCISGNVERAMVRTYMKDIVPQSIRLNIHQRGLQSADALLRIQTDWERIKLHILEVIDSDYLKELVDMNVYHNIINAVQECSSESLTPELFQKVYTLYSAASYIKYAQERNNE